MRSQHRGIDSPCHVTIHAPTPDLLVVLLIGELNPAATLTLRSAEDAAAAG